MVIVVKLFRIKTRNYCLQKENEELYNIRFFWLKMEQDWNDISSFVPWTSDAMKYELINNVHSRYCPRYFQCGFFVISVAHDSYHHQCNLLVSANGQKTQQYLFPTLNLPPSVSNSYPFCNDNFTVIIYMATCTIITYSLLCNTC